MYSVIPELKHLEGLIIAECLRCCAMNRRIEMDDVLQVAQIAASRAVSTYKPDKAKLSTYVTITIRRDLQKYSEKEHRLNSSPSTHMQHEEPVDPDYECCADYMLTMLTPRERSIIKLRYGLDYRQHDAAEIAEIYEMSVSNVNRIIVNAIAKIKEQSNVR